MVRLQRMSFIMCLMMLVTFIFPWATVQGENCAPLPEIKGSVLGRAGAAIPGTWYIGATPANADPNKLPIIFVQGLHGSAADWWNDTRFYGHNDMYDLAYQAGYRTAFVELYDAGGKGASQWDNGRILAEMLGNISRHFNQKVNVIAHSKGSVDTQTALVHYGAHPYVNQVMMLAAPNYGSNLADLAHSWYAGWLAKLLGKKDKATYEMQRGRMEAYREQTDTRSEAGLNAYYTAAGTDWGPFPLSAGGYYLKKYGPSDGMINEWSTHLPYAEHLFTAKLDHDLIRKGSAVFDKLNASLNDAANPAAKPSLQPVMRQATAADQYVYGQELAADKPFRKTISVDRATTKLVGQMLSKYSDTAITLTSPTGQKYSNGKITTDQDFFAGAKVHSYSIDKPTPGPWTVEIASKQPDAFLLATTFVGSDVARLEMPTNGRLSLQLMQPTMFNLTSFKMTVKDAKGAAANEMVNFIANPGKPGQFFMQLPPRYKSGFYNLTLELSGKDRASNSFDRTIVRSVYIK